MYSNIKAELYKMSKKKYNYFLVIISVITIVFIVYSLKGKVISNIPINRENLLNFIPIAFIILPTFMILFLPNFSEEFRNNTFKNSITLGIEKRTILLYKFFTTCIIFFIYSVICIGTFLISLLMLEPGNNFSNSLIIEFLTKFVVAFPTFLAVLAIIYLLMVIIKNDIIVCIVFYYGIMQLPFFIVIIEKLFSINLQSINRFILVSNLSLLINTTASINNYILIFILGILYTVLFLIFSIKFFDRKVRR